jgi:hypothetical protein
MLFGMHSLAQYVQQTRFYLKRVSAVDINKSTAENSSCFNERLLKISTDGEPQ